MRNYLIIVEGAHDITVMERMLFLNGIKDRINKEENVPTIWRHTIPAKYPFDEKRLDRIAPIPSFVKSDDISVAIKNANSDIEIMKTLQQILHYMEISDIAQLNGIMLVCDADEKSASDKKDFLLGEWKDTSDLKLDVENMQLETPVKRIPLYTFVFPDDMNSGNLENLLLETAQIAYPELLELASEYITKAALFSKKLKREQDVKKATIGCIANTMKPGKANQVSIGDDAWITEVTLNECEMLRRLDSVIKEMINE